MSRFLIMLPLFFGCFSVSRADDSASLLAHLLAQKGVISPSEAASVDGAAPDRRVPMLVAILAQKGVLTQDDVASLMPAAREPDQLAMRVVPAVYSTPAPPQTAAAPKAVVQGAPPAQAAPPMTSQNRFPITVYGTLLANAFFNTALTNIEDIPLFAGKQGSDPLGNDKNFGMTLRQSRFGMRYQGPKVGGAQINGQFEIDLMGGKAAFGNGVNMDMFRLRLAIGRLDWQNFSLVAGQDWSIFAPLNPTTLAEFGIPGFSASGNAWIRTPQFRLELRHSMTPSTRMQLQLAAVDPDQGDFNTTVFTSGRTPGIGERGRAPAVEARWGLTTHAHDRDFTVGLSSHYGRGKNAGTIGALNVQTGVNSWGVALDYFLPVTRKFILQGEAFTGRALGIFSVNAGQAVLPVGTPGQNGVDSYGGWSQAQFNVTPKWQLNLAYGIDLAKADQLRTGDRSKNQTYMGNLMYKWSPHVTFAWEWRRFLTDFRNQRAANEQGDHVNMAAAYTF